MFVGESLVFMVIVLFNVHNVQPRTIRSDESNSWHLLCEMKHKNEFVFDSSVTAFGCRLNCVVLKETRHEGGQNVYFDNADVYEHNLNDGIFCKRDHICKAGNCTLEITSADQPAVDRKGIIVVEVLEAHPPKKDQLTESDGYVKIPVKGPDGSLDVGQTKVMWDTSNPVYNHTTKIEFVSIKSTIFFEMYDQDIMNKNDYIGSVYMPIKRLLRENNNGKAIKLEFPDGWLKVSVTWLVNDV